MNIPTNLQSFLANFSAALQTTLNERLVGMYLHGSLTYGGYRADRSDIDVVVLVNEIITTEISASLDTVFTNLKQTHAHEVENIELDILLLSEVVEQPPVLSSQYTFMDNEPKGKEQLQGFWIELANTRENGIPIYGLHPKEIIPDINTDVLRFANQEKFADLRKTAAQWEKENLWNQTYIITQASRVLYSLNNDWALVSKQGALKWAAQHAPEQFRDMLQVTAVRLNNFDHPREQIISEQWEDYLDHIEKQLTDSD